MQRFQSILLALVVAAILALAVLGVLRQANPLLTLPSLDGGYYLYFGQRLLSGDTVYVDMWESKTPGIFYANLLGLWLARGSRWGVWVLEFFALFISAVASYMVLRKIYGFLPALIASLAWLWALDPILQGGNLTEEFSLPFSFLALLAFWFSLQNPRSRWPAFVIGLTFAASFLFRPNNAGVQTAMVLAWILSAVFEKDYRPLIQRLFWSGLGVALGLGLVSLYFISLGNFDELINASFLYNATITQGRSTFGETLFTGLAHIGIPAGFALLGYGLVINQAIEKRRAGAWELFLIILWPLEIVLSGLSGRGYDHYLIPWMVALAVLAAILFHSLPLGLSRFAERRILLTSACILVLGLFLSLESLAEYRQSFQRLVFERQAGIEMDHPVAAYIRENTQPKDTVLVWGARLALNFLSRRPAPTAYVFYPLFLETPFADQISDQFFVDLSTQKPALIIDSALVNQDLVPSLDPVIRREQFQSGNLWPTLPENIQAVLAYIDQHYVLVKTIGEYPIYRLK